MDADSSNISVVVGGDGGGGGVSLERYLRDHNGSMKKWFHTPREKRKAAAGPAAHFWPIHNECILARGSRCSSRLHYSHGNVKSSRRQRGRKLILLLSSYHLSLLNKCQSHAEDPRKIFSRMHRTFLEVTRRMG